MTMSPERFQELLAQGTAAAPPAPPVASDLAAGRERLRRRRMVAATAAVAAVVVVAGAVGLGTRVAGEDRGVDPAVPAPTRASDPAPVPPEPMNQAQLLEKCGSDDLPPGYFDGPETFVIGSATALTEIVAIESADGRYWAECTISLTDRAEPATVVSYDSQEPARGWESSLGAGCAPATSDCLYYAFSAVDRVSEEVAAVRIELNDGTTRTVPAERGYYVINIVERLPAGAGVDDQGRLSGISSLDFVHRLTYLDASGSPLAAIALDGSGGGVSGTSVGALPSPFDAYPSMKGQL